VITLPRSRDMIISFSFRATPTTIPTYPTKQPLPSNLRTYVTYLGMQVTPTASRMHCAHHASHHCITTPSLAAVCHTTPHLHRLKLLRIRDRCPFAYVIGSLWSTGTISTFKFCGTISIRFFPDWSTYRIPDFACFVKCFYPQFTVRFMINLLRN